ncbi:hypothetical protein BDK51DRAFT_48006 [Blyttiomyces helicus]|uniref:Uncharacterized protein n=1 Tax=Blyttiomyces helicus TaxID=388810 RepID=A0A4P9VXE5_9FUNG|nr:hypothetical protein BDK51DRAFT_48006 [Blyttiomyces helicus]|eukprot:RKO83373.1 hypothetical protein BDK51DRAFT_48006 [Blyttiomyces helicus]
MYGAGLAGAGGEGVEDRRNLAGALTGMFATTAEEDSMLGEPLMIWWIGELCCNRGTVLTSFAVAFRSCAPSSAGIFRPLLAGEDIAVLNSGPVCLVVVLRAGDRAAGSRVLEVDLVVLVPVVVILEVAVLVPASGEAAVDDDNVGLAFDGHGLLDSLPRLRSMERYRPFKRLLAFPNVKTHSLRTLTRLADQLRVDDLEDVLENDLMNFFQLLFT